MCSLCLTSARGSHAIRKEETFDTRLNASDPINAVCPWMYVCEIVLQHGNMLRGWVREKADEEKVLADGASVT